MIINHNSAFPIKKPILQEDLSKLKVEIQLVRYFDNSLKSKINLNIYQECLLYNEIDIIKNSESIDYSQYSTSITDKVVNSGRVEKEKREKIEKAIIEIIDNIKTIYPQF